MEWPSKNVPRGGMLHPHRVRFNPETKNYLKILTDESKMAIAQRKKSEYNLRDYESTPTPRRKTKKRFPKVVIRPGSSKRRSYDSIVQSGVLQREPFVPKPIVNREAEKKRLQDSMTYGKEGPPKPVVKKPAKKPEKFRPLNRFDQLVQEIRDREDWIAEMAQLGQDKKYKEIIDLQIQERIREMNKLDLDGDDSQTPATTVRTSV
ncbi:UPF0193 protein EVG1 homolog [Harmonia axyridis]|uniref:UPF0193 protein EVG1 homolog n=1 Tax=Harmonia axyridis TaxID=115357 RepID=UPI001E27911B|nr:UPF0193 protein EVG1 homolog [Harmonia axyridis]